MEDGSREGRRRGFLRMLGLVTAGVVASPGLVRADRIRVLGDGAGPDRLIAVGGVSPDFQRVVSATSVGEVRSHGPLTVFWLHARDQAPLDVATLEEARGQGSLSITERDQASVPELVVDNRGKLHVLLLAGEILVGGKQNRVLKEDILLPPASGPRNLSVYCVEQGRWNAGRKDFDSRGTLAAPSLRSQVMGRSDQSRVWAFINRSARAANADSPTGSYQQIYEQPEIKEHLKDVERGIDARPAPGAAGAAVFVGGALGSLDLFHSAGLFARQWPKLLRAHAIEAYRQPARQDSEEPRLRARVKELLAGAARVEGMVRGNAGVGQLFEFAVARARGAALVFEGRVIHSAIL